MARRFNKRMNFVLSCVQHVFKSWKFNVSLFSLSLFQFAIHTTAYIRSPHISPGCRSVVSPAGSNEHSTNFRHRSQPPTSAVSGTSWCHMLFRSPELRLRLPLVTVAKDNPLLPLLVQSFLKFPSEVHLCPFSSMPIFYLSICILLTPRLRAV